MPPRVSAYAQHPGGMRAAPTHGGERMTQADLERRIHNIEQKLDDIDRQLSVLSTGIALARWFGPFAVSIAAVIVVVLK